ncbi:transmembrane protein [Cystoisospora suis]|uniref:Transmembrane protein n=1 Tax=Cystoisospora suis TaxID=483139 RepID=A0A2C6L3B5_9APIC|nr:transmembrane protein [Cystoisospora suis]
MEKEKDTHHSNLLIKPRPLLLLFFFFFPSKFFCFLSLLSSSFASLLLIVLFLLLLLQSKGRVKCLYINRDKRRERSPGVNVLLEKDFRVIHQNARSERRRRREEEESFFMSCVSPMNHLLLSSLALHNLKSSFFSSSSSLFSRFLLLLFLLSFLFDHSSLTGRPRCQPLHISSSFSSSSSSSLSGLSFHSFFLFAEGSSYSLSSRRHVCSPASSLTEKSARLDQYSRQVTRGVYTPRTMTSTGDSESSLSFISSHLPHLLSHTTSPPLSVFSPRFPSSSSSSSFDRRISSSSSQSDSLSSSSSSSLLYSHLSSLDQKKRKRKTCFFISLSSFSSPSSSRFFSSLRSLSTQSPLQFCTSSQDRIIKSSSLIHDTIYSSLSSSSSSSSSLFHCGVFSHSPFLKRSLSPSSFHRLIEEEETALHAFTIFVNPDTAPEQKDRIVSTYTRMCIEEGHIQRIRENRRYLKTKKITRGCEGGSLAVLRRRKRLYWEKRNLRETEKRVLLEDFNSLSSSQIQRLIEAFRTNVALEEGKKKKERKKMKKE